RMLGQRARPVRRAGTGKPTLETVHGVSSPTQHMELDRRGAELLFQVLTEREEKNSVAIASNESFSGWTKTFTDPRLCAAIVDRLTFGGNIIETGTDSYRLATTRARAEQQSAAG
ncbi:ATP-binding protein, partial [Streptomyces sp. NPDC006602]|uniref:ATP-binding protein n=1 Tax=Streptomyces sp. NPDC006602 TaxID=3364751 RepID=UPI0036B93C75